MQCLLAKQCPLEKALQPLERMFPATLVGGGLVCFREGHKCSEERARGRDSWGGATECPPGSSQAAAHILCRAGYSRSPNFFSLFFLQSTKSHFHK